MKRTARYLSAIILPALIALWSAAGAAEELGAELRARLERIAGEVTNGQAADDIRATPIPNLYEMQYGTEFIYITGDGRYVLTGADLLDLEERENLSERYRNHYRARSLYAIPPEEFIEFAPSRPRHVLYVFTDVNCGYCRRLHSDVPELNRNGVAVRYLAYPVIGDPVGAKRAMESVWCAADRRDALTKAKAGLEVAEASCASPVDKHTRLGRDFGITGTPAMYTEDGRELPGYLPPGRLIQALGG